MRAIIVLFACASIFFIKVSANLDTAVAAVAAAAYQEALKCRKYVAPFITPCHAHDTACLKSSAQNAVPILAAGVPSLGIETMDPMRIDRVQASQAGLNMDFKNTLVKGLRNCKVLSLKRKTTKTDLEIKCSVLLRGDYKLDGRLLIFPVEGDGKYKIIIRDIVVKIAFEVSKNKVNGDEYWKVENWKHTAEVLTKVKFYFQNLFGNKNKQLADTVLEFANTNWRDIFHEVAPPVVKAVVSKVVEQVDKLFDKVPIKELDLDTE